MADHVFRYTPHADWEMRVDLRRCVASVHEKGRGVRMYQCYRKRLPDTEWCRQHSLEAHEERKRKSNEKYEAQNERWERPRRIERRLNAVIAMAQQSLDDPNSNGSVGADSILRAARGENE